MKLPRRKFLHLAAGAAALPAASRIAWAQAYPSRPITFVVPFAPGGANDVIGRILAPGMRASLGQTIIIENVAGASGSIGTGRVARAAPDGYTLIVGYWGTHVANGAVYELKYDVLNDFEPVCLVATQPLVIVAKKAMPADDLKGLVAWLKANPDRASAGTAGVGAVDHVGGALFQTATGTRFQFVPYVAARLRAATPAAGRVATSSVISTPSRMSIDLSATTGVDSHSVAADSETNLVYVPIRGNNAVAGSGAVC